MPYWSDPDVPQASPLHPKAAADKTGRGAVIVYANLALELGGTIVFALSGALVAARLGQTPVAMAFFALISGVGGGTLRDMLLGVQAAWLSSSSISAAILATTIVAWYTPTRWWDGKALEWADAAGLSAFAVLGTGKALAFDIAVLPAIVLGIVSGCAGGVIRDVIAGVPSILMRPELYVVAAALASTIAATGPYAAQNFAIPLSATLFIAWIAGFSLRGAAIEWHLGLPSYRRHHHRPSEDGDHTR